MRRLYCGKEEPYEIVSNVLSVREQIVTPILYGRIHSHEVRMMASRQRSALEREGVAAVELAISREFKWIFREQPVDDYGVDAHIEIFEEDEQPSGRLIGVQIKSGRSYFDEENHEGFVYRGQTKHLKYWQDHRLPIILVLYDPESQECFWTPITKENVVTTGTAWKVTIPKRRKLTPEWRNYLVEFAAASLVERRYRKLALDLPLIERLSRDYRLIVEGGQWVNKLSGRSEMNVILVDSDGNEETLRDWGFILAPSETFVELVSRFFPWANIEIDEDAYEQYDEAQFDLECGIWDGESHEYIGHWQSLSEWKENQPRLRPYENASGEFDSYRLELSLNELGKAIPLVSEFIETGCFIHAQAEDDSEYDYEQDEEDDE